MASSNDYETVIVARKEGKNVVMISEESYNGLLENAYLTASKANYDWPLESRRQYEECKAVPNTLLENQRMIFAFTPNGREDYLQRPREA